MNEAIRMQISAFVDGELPDNEADLLLRRMSQDAALRQEVASYLAIGRVMRGEASPPAAEGLHARVMAELGDAAAGEREAEPTKPQSRAVRPLAGIAIAASVALLAIFGLQQTSTFGPADAVDSAPGVAAESFTVVPQSADERLRQYYLSHGAIATENGANGMNARLVTLMRQEALEEAPSEEQDDEAQDETSRP